MQKIIKSFFSQYQRMTKQKQFNKKIELKQALDKFKRDNQITILPYDGSKHAILLNGLHVADMVNHATPENKQGFDFNPANFKLQFLSDGQNK